jgi:hypothetical protein
MKKWLYNLYLRVISDLAKHLALAFVEQKQLSDALAAQIQETVEEEKKFQKWKRVFSTELNRQRAIDKFNGIVRTDHDIYAELKHSHVSYNSEDHYNSK